MNADHLNTRLREQGIAQVIADTEAAIRAEPRVAGPRWLLFQLLCVIGDWARALKQLPLAVEAIVPEKAGLEIMADQYRQLISAELARGEVFSGMAAPRFHSEAPIWALTLIEAMALEAMGNQEAADARREAGLAEAPTLAGRTSLGPFAWLADADSRLGPVGEFLQDGQYYWLPFDTVTSFFVRPPERLIDLVWAPVSVAMRDGSVLQGHMPARYPGSEDGRDAIRLGHETLWQERGSTAVCGLGQKMWMSDGGDWALRDLRECHFGNDETKRLAEIIDHGQA